MSKTAKRIKDKKPTQLKLASMSEHWVGRTPPKSGKHRSQEIQKMKRRNRKRKSKIPQP
jgi:hypothetical protein